MALALDRQALDAIIFEALGDRNSWWRELHLELEITLNVNQWDCISDLRVSRTTEETYASTLSTTVKIHPTTKYCIEQSQKNRKNYFDRRFN